MNVVENGDEMRFGSCGVKKRRLDKNAVNRVDVPIFLEEVEWKLRNEYTLEHAAAAYPVMRQVVCSHSR